MVGAEGSQQVSVVVAAKQPRAVRHTRERSLDLVLRLLAGAAQRPHDTVAHLDAIRENRRVKRAWKRF